MSVETFTPARSSFISELSFDDDTDQLTVSFNDGKSFTYFGVSRATYRNFTLAPSMGQFFHRHIKDGYRYEEA